jgi:hypothetical protein
MAYDNDYDYNLLEEWQAYSFVCDCVGEEYCDNRKGVHQRFRGGEVDDEKLEDILAGHIVPGFFDSLTVENIVRVAQLEMEQHGASSAHDDANKKKKNFQKGLRMQKPIQQQPWPLGPIRPKVRMNPRTGKREVKLSYSSAADMSPNCSSRICILFTSATHGNVGGREK